MTALLQQWLLDHLLTGRVHHMDALELLSLLPDASVDLIVTDPPYNGVKDNAWDNQWRDDEHFLEWLELHVIEMRRVLKSNGSLYLFTSPRLAARAEVMISKHFSVLSQIVWRKPSSRHNQADVSVLRDYFPQTERIVFAEHLQINRTGLEEILNDQTLFTELRSYFWQERQKIAHLSYNEINQRMGLASNGGGMASNILNSYKINWSFPARETYELLAQVTGVCQRPYTELAQEYEQKRQEYEQKRRPFYATPNSPYTDVWEFPTVNTYPGKHVCEKPLSMAEHIVRVSSRPGALVLDPFAGSGNLLRGAFLQGRRYIGGDADAYWARVADTRVKLPFNLSLFDALEGAA